ncbi:prephenate dehydratase [Lactobacillus sp. LC28-10]|uniref:Prephenate dehydratase n=1 Tax=Secundilactobacillus angelensis TaxID=2722706 RepID=A0ABX1KYC4_9LACO|nr:prephenate dehydratase domain-containing protein [Secundilactobacillus angelensis]MCH5462020.1 prephenate dehydratase [Secundilactobacillus angelensis]NLR18942.1 prephenate dehydratase [Secundilactobacillus angelensis]
MKFSVLGPAGTFADAAAQKYLRLHPIENIEIDYHDTFDQVYQAVTPDGLGLLPLENQLDGFVLATLQRLQVANITEVGEVTVPVNFGLAGKVHNLAEIKRIYVQFKTEGQCQQLLAQLPNAQIITTSSNMISVEKLRDGIDGDAAIMPQSQLAVEDFPFTMDNVADQDANNTRFIIFKKQPAVLELPAQPAEDESASFKSALFITPPTEEVGVLYQILSYFAKTHLNLVTIMSMPTRQKIGIYSFYIEISGTLKQKSLLFETLQRMADIYTIHPLGVYAL